MLSTVAGNKMIYNFMDVPLVPPLDGNLWACCYLKCAVNPVRKSRGALNPAGIILKSNPAAEPCTAWCTGQSSGALFLTG
jgi:hypothetical protein